MAALTDSTFYETVASTRANSFKPPLSYSRNTVQILLSTHLLQNRHGSYSTRRASEFILLPKIIGHNANFFRLQKNQDISSSKVLSSKSLFQNLSFFQNLVPSPSSTHPYKSDVAKPFPSGQAPSRAKAFSIGIETESN
ncbi:hypothetical protein AVEN_157832-1 [Araneus ventricosus]|uniref:Uncharacterized protein n=1 Tax=Araneus ventricosus TaxID=182803 RepID=A0A4Y2NS55_ARAVE|nr:hypothetical protein AVEN_157832-1 [Araneus ventricosus]